MGSDCAGAGNDHRRAAGKSSHDRRARANGAEPRVWRALRDVGWHRGILFARSECIQIHDECAVPGSDTWLAVIYGKLDGRGEITGIASTAANHLQRPEYCEPRIAGRIDWRGQPTGIASGENVFIPADYRHPFIFWRDDDYSHRRGGYAHGDFAP